ncbi:RTA1 like protein-domain-containing protein [Mycena amicta]|nr:RTA1 like protein-domain-containing protein [Mycena amicta]
MSTSLRLLTLAAFCATALAANNDSNTDADLVVGGFTPKKGPALVALILFGISALIQWMQFFVVKPRRPFILYLTFGMTAMATGFVLRIVFADDPSSLGKYIAMDLFILLSPCLFLATDYMILSHLVRTFDKEVAERCLLVRQSRIVKIFVWSDVTTFLLQSSGGALTASKNNSNAKIGNDIAMIGIILQAVSFLLFTVVFLVFGFRVKKHFPKVWRPETLLPGPFRVFSRQPIEDWRILFYITCITCVGIIIRSVFRVVEFAGGYSGTVFTHEGYFYVFDSLPLWIAMSLYCVIWPIRAFNRSSLSSMEMSSQKQLAASI